MCLEKHKCFWNTCDQQSQLFHIKNTVRLLSKNDVKKEHINA